MTSRSFFLCFCYMVASKNWMSLNFHPSLKCSSTSFSDFINLCLWCSPSDSAVYYPQEWNKSSRCHHYFKMWCLRMVNRKILGRKDEAEDKYVTSLGSLKKKALPRNISLITIQVSQQNYGLYGNHGIYKGYPKHVQPCRIF